MKSSNYSKAKKNDLFAVVGIHSIAAILTESLESVIKLWISKNHNQRVEALLDQARAQDISIEIVRDSKLDDIGQAHQSVVAWCRPPVIYDFAWLLEHQLQFQLLLALDKITDSHNFGACLRSAEAAGADAVLIAKKNSCGINSGVAKSDSGALFRLPLVQIPIASGLKKLRAVGMDVIGLSEHASESIYSIPFMERTVLVVGSEEKGISTQVESICSQVASIPCTGSNSSLNVSVASAIAMFEICRKRSAS